MAKIKKVHKTKEQKLLEKIQKVYEKYPDRPVGLGNWNTGGFIDDERYKQPIKHKLYR